jgi:hypothetical protein
MAAQDYSGRVIWVIVDDGQEFQPVTFERDGWSLVHIHPEPKPGINTQARNLLAGLDAIPDDARLVIIEDDDYYAPDWLTKADTELDYAELVGECQARYYNVANRCGRQLQNREHASLCATAMRGPAINKFRNLCSQSQKFIDMNLWRDHANKKIFRGHRVTGIKGLPGREGIGMGHRRTFRGQNDPRGTLLHEWIGKDAELYL